MEKFKEEIKVNDFYGITFESFDNSPDNVHVIIDSYLDKKSMGIKVPKDELAKVLKKILN